MIRYFGSICNNRLKSVSVEVEILLTFFDHDKKRLHFRMEMIEKKTKKLSSTIEMLSLHVDLNKRKVAEFDQERTRLMDEFISENKEKFLPKTK